jgi:hypothetical protein
MPKMIGITPEAAEKALGIIVSAAPEAARNAEALRPQPGQVRVTWGTLRALAKEGLITGASAVQVATDRGGPRCLAKRWWAWYVPAEALAAYRADHPLRVKRPR